MSEQTGRSVALTIGSAIATARTKGFTINNTVIDVTSDDDDSVQRLLDEPGQKSVEVSVSGMFDNTETGLLDLALNDSDIVETVTFAFSEGLSISGDFAITSFGITGEYNDAVTFDASFSSTEAFAKAT